MKEDDYKANEANEANEALDALKALKGKDDGRQGDDAAMAVVKGGKADAKGDKADGKDDKAPSLKEVIKEQAIEGEAPMSRSFSLRKILGGDILSTSFMRRQVWLFLLIAFFLVLYVANRYSCQQDIIEIDKLQNELQDAKYRALSSNSQLTEKSRERYVIEMLKNNKDSVLKMPSQPPYLINVPAK